MSELPQLSVVIASHQRPLRLRWALNALAAQSEQCFEVIVGHDSGEPTEQVLRSHPLSADGRLRWVASPPGTALPGANRNRALELARAPLVAFTDDDCRPPADWVAQVLAAAAREPGAVIQGPVLSDPVEAAMLRSSFPRTQHFTDVPRPWAECANIVYPRSALEPFREDMATGEDAELCLRVRARGVPFLGAPTMVTYHAVSEGSLLDALRGAPRWADLVKLLDAHPELRSQLLLGTFWKPTHFWLLVAAATPGLPAGGWRRSAQLGAAGGWMLSRRWRGGGVRGKLRHLSELPAFALVDCWELLLLARASLREGSLLL